MLIKRLPYPVDVVFVADDGAWCAPSRYSRHPSESRPRRRTSAVRWVVETRAGSLAAGSIPWAASSASCGRRASRIRHTSARAAVSASSDARYDSHLAPALLARSDRAAFVTSLPGSVSGEVADHVDRRAHVRRPVLEPDDRQQPRDADRPHEVEDVGVVEAARLGDRQRRALEVVRADDVESDVRVLVREVHGREHLGGGPRRRLVLRLALAAVRLEGAGVVQVGHGEHHGLAHVHALVRGQPQVMRYVRSQCESPHAGWTSPRAKSTIRSRHISRPPHQPRTSGFFPSARRRLDALARRRSLSMNT